MKTSIFNSKNLQFILALGYMALFYTPFIWNMDVMYSILVAKSFYFYAVSISLFLIAIIYLLLSNDALTINLGWLDIIIVVYTLYLFIRLIFTDYVTLYNGQFIIHIFLIGHYFVLKKLFKNKISASILIIAILAGGLGQAVYGLLQLYDLNPGYPRHYFKVVGTIGNPNSYAGFLSSVLPFAFGLYYFLEPANNINKFLKYFAVITAGAIILILPSTNTRGAWIASSAGLLYVLFHKYNIGLRIKQTINTKTKAVFSAITVIVLLSGLFSGLYHLKPDSAFGRLFIWKVTANMIKEKPVFGIGYNRYIVDYNNYQADYFGNNEASDYEIKVADNNKQAHNEYLQMTSEVGITGLIIFLVMIFFFLYMRDQRFPEPKAIESNMMNSKMFVTAVRASLVALLVFAMFSYPLRLLVTNINFFVFLAIISCVLNNKTNFTLQLSNRNKTMLAVIGIMALLLITINKFSVYRAHQIWRIADLSSRFGMYEQTIKYCRSIYPTLYDDGKFLFFYGGILYKKNEYQKAEAIFIQAKNYFSDPNLDILMAKTAMKLEKDKMAEIYLMHAINMVPHKFYPRYLLAKLFKKLGYPNKAMTIAKDLSDMDIKIHSPAIQDMRNEMKLLLDSVQIQP